MILKIIEAFKESEEENKEEGKKPLLNSRRLEKRKCQGSCKNINLRTMIRKGKPEDVMLKTAKEGVDQMLLGKSSGTD